MAGEFNAGGGRIQITGDASGGVKATRETTAALLEMEKKAAGTFQSRGGMLGGAVSQLNAMRAGIGRVAQAFFGWTAIIGIISGVVAGLHRMVTVTQRQEAAAKKLRLEIYSLFDVPPTGLQAELDALDAKTGEILAKIRASSSSLSSKQRMSEIANEANLRRRNLLIAERNAQVEIDSFNTIQDKIAALKEQAKAMEREAMTPEQRAAAERADLEEQLKKLEEGNITDLQRQHIAAIRARFDAAKEFIKKEKDARSETVGLADLAKRFDTASVVLATKENTAAIKNLKLNGGGGGPGIKD